MGRHLLAAAAGRTEARSGIPPGPGFPVLTCAGVPITGCGPDQATRLVLDRATAASAAGLDVHLCNAYTIALADRDHGLHALLCHAGLNFADGMSVVWANRLRHRGEQPPTERVYGPDLFREVLRLGQPAEVRHYLVGSTPAVLTALQDRLALEYPGVQVVGAESPPFRPLTGDERGEQAARIRRSRAQIVWVGLGTPKQDWAAARLAAELPVVAIAVGAAFDFVAGTKAQAPPWMRRAGLEWCHRLAAEPRRLWRRYLLGNVRFGYAVARARREPAGRGW